MAPKAQLAKVVEGRDAASQDWGTRLTGTSSAEQGHSATNNGFARMTTLQPRIGLISFPRYSPATVQATCWRIALLALVLLLGCASAIAAPTSIHGHVTSHFTGQPMAGARLEIVDAQYRPIGGAAIDAAGAYQWSGECPDSAGAVCIAVVFRTYDAIRHDAATASFANGAQDAVVDLQPHAMAYLNGSVRGLPPAANYVGPVLAFRYNVASSSWQAVGDVQQNALREIGGFVPEGRYRLCVGGLAVGLQRQCFDHRPEAGSWVQQTYTDIDLAEGETRDDIDFDLVPGGSIAGALIDAWKGVPFVSAPYNGHWAGLQQVVSIDLYDADGVRFDYAYAYTDQQGKYRFSGTPTGTFRVQLGTELGEFRDPVQVYPGVACTSLACPINAGTPISTNDQYTVYGINMPLHPNVTIRGTVTDAVTHQPIAGVTVAAWHLLPDFFGEAPPQYEVYWTQSDAQGNYTAYGAPDSGFGIYVAAGSAMRVASIYPNAACPSGVESLCNDPFPWSMPPYGVGVAVDAHTGDSINGIDFALQQGGAFSGFIRDLNDAPLFASLTIYNASGASVAAFPAHGYDAFGNTAAYQSPALPPGTYYATANYAWNGPCQAYSGRPCPTPAQSILDVAPTPITISAGANHTGVDFRIPADQLFADGFGG